MKIFILLALVAYVRADVSHLFDHSNNLEDDGYHYNRPIVDIPKNDYLPPPSVKLVPKRPAAAKPVIPVYQPAASAPTPTITGVLKEDGYHYEKPKIPLVPVVRPTPKNEYLPPPVVKPVPPKKPVTPKPATLRPEAPIYQPAASAPTPTITGVLKEDGYHYEKPKIPLVPVVRPTPKNEYLPPPVVKPVPPKKPVTPKPATRRPEAAIYQPAASAPTPTITGVLKEDGYHYEKPAIPLVPVVRPTPKNEYLPPPVVKPPAPKKPVTPKPATLRPVVPIYQPAASAPTPTIAGVLKEDGYHYEKPKIPLVPVVRPTPKNEYLPPPVVKPAIPLVPVVRPTPKNEYLPPPVVKPVPPKKFVTPKPATLRPVVPIYQPAASAPTPTITGVLKEDGYHYEKPAIPLVPVVRPTPKNEYLPPPVVKPVPPKKPVTPKPATRRPEAPIYQPAASAPTPTITGVLKEDGYHYEKPAIPLVPVVRPTPKNEYLPPPVVKPVPPKKPVTPKPATRRPVVPIYQPAASAPTPTITGVLKEDGYHYEKPRIPLVPVVRPTPKNEYLPPPVVKPVPPKKLVTPKPATPRPVVPIYQPAASAPTPIVITPARPVNEYLPPPKKEPKTQGYSYPNNPQPSFGF